MAWCIRWCHPQHHILRFCLLITCLTSLAAISVNPAGAADKQVSEYEVKAACLYNFIRFVDWPETGKTKPDSLMVIGILGEDRFGNAFAPVEGRLVKANSRRLLIKRFGHYDRGVDPTACHVLFISATERTNARRIIKDLENAPVLTVGEFEGFLELGGIINLITVDEKIRWEVHRGQADRAGLEFSSQLLRTATRVLEAGGRTTKSGAR
ncbi:MAG: YfiR family protein [Candidatus Eisenbacteria bacterium]